MIQKMTCPFLLVHGEGDQQVPTEDAHKAIEACGSSRKELKIFTREEGGYHHARWTTSASAPRTYGDWAADMLQAGR